MQFGRRNAFQTALIIFFPEKKNKKEYVCHPYLKYSDLLVTQNTLIFYLALPRQYFVLKMLSPLNVCYILSSTLQTRFIMEESNMNPDQTAPREAV